jgi:hypothetical protein
MKASNDYANNMHFTDRSDREEAFLKSPLFGLRHRNYVPHTYQLAGTATALQSDVMATEVTSVSDTTPA